VGPQPCGCVAEKFRSRREAIIKAEDLLAMANVHVVRSGKIAMCGGFYAALPPTVVPQFVPDLVHWFCLQPTPAAGDTTGYFILCHAIFDDAQP
jgi:hypothetical protein